MASCNHKNLLLLGKGTPRVRCRACSLVISEQELNGGFCPECYAVTRKRCHDFEAVPQEVDAVTRYRCEGCGAVIEWKD